MRIIAFPPLFVAQIRDSGFGYSRRQRTGATNRFAFRTKRAVFGRFVVTNMILKSFVVLIGFQKPFCVRNKTGRCGTFCGHKHDFKIICGSDWVSPPNPFVRFSLQLKESPLRSKLWFGLRFSNQTL